MTLGTEQHRRRAFMAAAGALALLPVQQALAALAPSAAAPDFTLRTMAGPNLRLAEQRGRVVLVNFWATWCAPCRQEMPHLDRLYRKYKASGFQLLAVNVDDNAGAGADLATKMALSFPVLFDADKRVSKAYELSSMPATVLIDRDGRVRHLHRGYREGMEETYDQQIRALLKE